ncbi:MAG: hypothetical protein Q8K73_06230, partial [Anaerolineales bacterium]|nr:hypothetical protein [Anaerolineales bacterium]
FIGAPAMGRASAILLLLLLIYVIARRTLFPTTLALHASAVSNLHTNVRDCFVGKSTLLAMT